MRIYLILIVAAITFCPNQYCSADIISTSFNAFVSANFDGTVDTSSSNLDNDMLSALATGNNSLTQSDLDYSWNGVSLTGSSDLRAEKTISARPGGDHIGSSLFEFTFELDQATDFDLSGTWGFDTAQPGGDTLTFSLLGSSGVIAQGTSAGTTGVNSDSFSQSGQLTAGTYTLTFNGQLTETINNQGLALAGWTISQFSLSNTAIPEPAGIWIAFGLGAWVMTCRRKS